MLETGAFPLLATAGLPGAVTVTAGNTNNACFGANALKLFGLPINSRIYLTYRGTRVNTAAGGSGAYRFRINGVNDANIQTVFGTQQCTVVLSTIVALGPGDNTIEVSLVAAVGDETMQATGSMFAIGSIGT